MSQQENSSGLWTQHGQDLSTLKLLGPSTPGLKCDAQHGSTSMAPGSLLGKLRLHVSHVSHAVICMHESKTLTLPCRGEKFTPHPSQPFPEKIVVPYPVQSKLSGVAKL